jgi:hypothetical protein
MGERPFYNLRIKSGHSKNQIRPLIGSGNKRQEANVFSGAYEEANMPVFFIMWAVPAVILIGGVGYYLVRAVN